MYSRHFGVRMASSLPEQMDPPTGAPDGFTDPEIGSPPHPLTHFQITTYVVI